MEEHACGQPILNRVPQGTTSKTGRIAAFKKGPFVMAARAGVPIVPISVIGTRRCWPPGSFAPVAVPRGIRIIIHRPIEALEGDTLLAARQAIISALPASMQPLPVEDAEVGVVRR